MKPLLFTAITGAILFSITDFSIAQDYDLIVTSKGDSIACHIDSITESDIFFRMKVRGSWTPTNINLDMASFMSVT